MLSVVVPVYNVEKYLARCLYSLVNQTLKDIEIICVNDGSKDNSRNILETYAQKYSQIKIIDRENGGLSAARNTGIDAAKGDYIGFVDSDDWVDLDYYEKLYNAVKKHDADIAESGIIRLSRFYKKYHIKYTDEKVIVNTLDKFIISEVPNKWYVWNKIYKSSMFNNLKFIEGICHEDVIFTPQALYNSHKLVTVPDTFYYYWRTPNSIVRRKITNKGRDYEYTHKWAENFFKEYNIDTSYSENIVRVKLFGKTIYKIVTQNGKKTLRLFNFIKIRIPS